VLGQKLRQRVDHFTKARSGSCDIMGLRAPLRSHEIPKEIPCSTTSFSGQGYVPDMRWCWRSDRKLHKAGLSGVGLITRPHLQTSLAYGSTKLHLKRGIVVKEHLKERRDMF
jgi:hypothetical protein